MDRSVQSGSSENNRDCPRSLSDLDQWYSTEEACLELLARFRWSNGFTCPSCGGNRAWSLMAGLRECYSCGRQTSVTAGTVFHGTHKPLVLWFRVIWWVVSQEQAANALALQHALDVGCYRTAWVWLHKLRKVMAFPASDKLSGVVQVGHIPLDVLRSTEAGCRKPDKGIVFIAAEEIDNGTGRIRMKHMREVSGPLLVGAVCETVRQGTLVKTNDDHVYAGLDKAGYGHVVSHTDRETTDGLLPLCHRHARLFKCWLEDAYCGSAAEKHLDCYLEEYSFRQAQRTDNDPGRSFCQLLRNAVAVDPIPYGEIVRNRRRPGISTVPSVPPVQ